MEVLFGYVLGRLVDEDPYPRRWTNRFVDIAFTDPMVSPVHCAVWREVDGTHWIRDLRSKWGTHILRNNVTWQVMGPTPLLPGDTVIIGCTKIPWTRSGDFRMANC